jgi:hypothetical protein
VLPWQVVGLQFWVVWLGQLALPPEQKAGRMAVVPLRQLAARHCVDDPKNPSTGQVVLTPSQNSATSQTPAEARHCWVLGAGSYGQVLSVPLHLSIVHGLPSLVQAVPEDFLLSGQVEEPVEQ